MIAHGEQVFPRVKEKCSSKQWFASKDISSLEELIGRLRRLKENVGFLANRVIAIQTGLDSWQAEQINRKLYYLSFLSIIFLPLSVITGGKQSLLKKKTISCHDPFEETHPIVSELCPGSIWHECWWSTMDRAEKSRAERGISQRHASLRRNAYIGASLLQFPSYLYLLSYVESAEEDEKELVSQ